MAEIFKNKVIYGGDTLIDLTSDTVEQNKVLAGYTFHHKSGAIQTGTCDYDADTSDATASASEILATRTAYVSGAKVTGSMVNNGGVTGTIATKAQEYAIPTGYHDGSGKVSIAETEQNKIIPSNIKAGVVVLGIEGEYTGEAISAQSKTATPTTSSQTILPDAGYDYLSQVTVNAIPYTETLNSAGGYTVTIG